MVLCYICRGIDFDNPPRLPQEYLPPGLPDPEDTTEELYCLQLKSGYSPPEMFGYTHYQSLSDLKASAQNDCGICTMIYDEFHRIYKALTKRRSSWRFFITEREHKQKGFLVWTDGDYGMRRVGAFGYVIKHPDTDPLAKIYPGRLVVSDAQSNDCWTTAEHWIHHCNKRHDNCGPGKDDVLLPTRVIYVGKNDNDLKLVNTNDKGTGSYVALSYSWGTGQNDKKGNPLTFPYRLQKTNMANYLKSIPASALQNAQTIVDAIRITRKLGIKYLWVDALCIEQRVDSDPKYFQTKDFQTQAPKMGQYYSNAYLTLSSAWSTTSDDGVYNKRPSLPSYTWIHHNIKEDVKGKLTIVPLSLKKENIMPMYVVMGEEAIAARGWTLQERILSPRTLFYAEDQMYWECNELFLSENGFRATGRMYSADKHTDQISVWDEGPKQDPRELWAVLIQSYSRRNLGNPSDKLVAVAGLADKFSKLFKVKVKEDYLAGLWKKTMIEDLFWTADRPFMKWKDTQNWTPSGARAPSWSWAAFDFDAKLKIQDDTHGSIYPSDDRIRYGEKLAVCRDFGATYIQLNAPVLHLHIDPNRTHIGRGQYAFTFKKRELHYKTELDFAFQLSEVSGISIYAAILARDAATEPNKPIYLCLLITPIGKEYRRVGTLWIDENVLGNHAPDFMNDWWNFKFV